MEGLFHGCRKHKGSLQCPRRRVNTFALSAVAQEVQFLRSVHEFLQPHPVSFAEDNDGVCKLVKKASSLGRTRHIDVRHHFLRGLVDGHEISVKSVSTVDQTADVLSQ
ncbi:unnamed protein product, partial [Discosporangium mesarthrocarpum]